MQIQPQRVQKFDLGLPQIPFGWRAATAIKNAIRARNAALNTPGVQAAANPPAATQVPLVPGAVLPTQEPTYLFPTTTEQPAPASTPKEDDSTRTILLIGGIVVVGVIAAIALSR